MKCAGMLMPAAVLGTSVAALAGPLDSDLVPASAKWVLHVDVEAVAHSTIGKMLHQGLDLEEAFAEMKEMGIDPLEDVYSVTAYGWGEINEHNMVLVVLASESINDVIQAKAHEAGIEGEVDGDWTFYSGAEHGEEHAIGVHADDDDVRIFIAANRQGVEKAARGRDGDDRAEVIGRGPRRGAMIFAAARDLAGVVPEWGGQMPHSQLVSSTDAILIEIGERDDKIRGRLHATCADTQTSEDVVELLQGTLALGRMMARDNEDLAPLAQLASALTIESEQSVVKIEIELPTEMLMSAMESMGECEDEEY